MYDNLKFDPARNPATLDSITWDPKAAMAALEENAADLEAILEATNVKGCSDCAKAKLAEIETKAIKFSAPSFGMVDDRAHVLATLPDGQKVFLCTPKGCECTVPKIGHITLNWGKLGVTPVNVETVKIAANVTGHAPKAAGTASRLGVGNRQSVTVWPGIFAAMTEIGGPGEIVQNSAYRELAPVEFILAPPSDEATYLPGHGSLNIGHTGSSIQGLWLQGVVSAMEHGFTTPYGADLDHIPVKGLDDASIAKAKHLIESGRHYTFFTLDTSFLMKPEATDLEERYGAAIEAGAMMFDYIKSLKGDEAFDFEFSLDEGPAITTPEEQEFVLKGLAARGVKVDFIAPNVGFEKRVDYRLPDGLPGLEERVKKLSQIAANYGAVLDFHSGSDKAPLTYQTISKACGGNIKLKVSGKLQLILSEVLADVDPEFFNFWWDWTLKTAKGEAGRGSDVAAKYVGLVEQRMASDGASFKKSPKDLFFTDFSFAMVGAKAEDGSFLFRDRFYSLSPSAQGEYTRRVKEYLLALAGDLGVRA